MLSRSERTPWEEGNPASKLCVLGEAPSYVEMKLGRPLVGPSGEIFNDLLNQAGLARAQTYILNLWPYQVTKDRMGNIYNPYNECLWHNRKGLTDIGEKEGLASIDKARKCGANAILTLGSPPMDALAGGRRPIMKWRGSPLYSKRISKKFIPTVHPAATLHGVYVWRYFILWDMQKVRDELSHHTLVLPDRNLIIRPSYSEAMEYFDVCRQAGRVTTDLECMNNHVSCFSLSYRKDEALTIPFIGPEKEDFWTEEQEIKIWLKYAQLMSDRKVEKINHNLIGFDAVFLFSQCGIYVDCDRPGDTMIAQSILYPDFRMGLDVTASMHTRQPYWKDDGKIWKANSKIPWDTFQRYCALDAAATMECWDVLAEKLSTRDGGYWETYDMTVRLKDALCYMAVRGLKINKEGLAKTTAMVAKKLEQKYDELAQTADYPFNPLSPAQCAKYFYEHLGHDPYKNAAGGISTDDKAMSRLVRKASSGAREAKLVQEIRALNKLKGTYLEVELDLDERLRCSWNPRGTVFGRLSSSKTIAGTGMNLQNLHPEFKSFIVAG